MILSYPLQWRHNGRDGVSNHQSHDCLLNRLLRRRSKKTSELRVTGLCAGSSPGTGDFPAQMASYAENVSIWWRHHDQSELLMISATLQSPTTCSTVCALGKNPGSVSNWKFVCLYFHLFCNPHFACTKWSLFIAVFCVFLQSVRFTSVYVLLSVCLYFIRCKTSTWPPLGPQ